MVDYPRGFGLSQVGTHCSYEGPRPPRAEAVDYSWKGRTSGRERIRLPDRDYDSLFPTGPISPQWSDIGGPQHKGVQWWSILPAAVGSVRWDPNAAQDAELRYCPGHGR